MLKKCVLTMMGGLLAVTGLSASSVLAQQAVMDEFYGNGVHSFYDRDFFQAMNHLSVAIDGGSKDPRAYYYRGLARLKTGNTAGAKQDMQRGADLETADVDQFYPVAKSLERVQGTERRELERYRSLARAHARDRQMRRDAVRYEERRRAEAQVLRAVPVGPPPAALQVAPATAVEPVTPVAPSPAASAPAAPPLPTNEPADTGANPFDAPADEMPADAPADDNPFGGASSDDDNPFGDAGGDDANPFGDDPN